MTIKYSKTLALAAVAAISAMMVTPSQAVETTGTIRVVVKVINDNAGTKLPSDFTLNVKHWGAHVVGSPFIATGAPGTTFVVEQGTYVISEAIIEGYNGTWSGVGVTNGFIDLQPGQDITIIRTLDDNGVSTATTVAPEEPATENGGVLPNTATPWFNLLLVASLVAAAGAFGVRKSLLLHNAK
jgi:hypothetical protein